MTSETVVCVGALVVKDGALLGVRQARGHSLQGQWTIPWGRLGDGESPSRAAIREVKEEGGITASVDGLLGVQELPDPWDGWIAMVYLCRHQQGQPHPDNHETDAARYLTLEQLNALDEPIEPWSEWIMRSVLTKHYTLTERSEGNPFSPSVGFL